MEEFVIEKFFKQTNCLPADELILDMFPCSLDSGVNCAG